MRPEQRGDARSHPFCFDLVVNGWDKGDFNYDGFVNGYNFALLAANFNKGASGYSAAHSPGDWAALVAFAQ
jgi:hypothetical protein